jgi:hypothetical protein
MAFLDEIIEIAALSPPYDRKDALTEILMSGWIRTSHNALLVHYKAFGWAAWIALTNYDPGSASRLALGAPLGRPSMDSADDDVKGENPLPCKALVLAEGSPRLDQLIALYDSTDPDLDSGSRWDSRKHYI